MVGRMGVSSGEAVLRSDEPLVHVKMLDIPEQSKYGYALTVLGRLEEAEAIGEESQTERLEANAKMKFYFRKQVNPSLHEEEKEKKWNYWENSGTVSRRRTKCQKTSSSSLRRY